MALKFRPLAVLYKSLDPLESKTASQTRAVKKALWAAAMLASLLGACLPSTAHAQATAWGWMSGVETVNANNSSTTPGSREGAATWIDSDDHLWLFGGMGRDSSGMSGYLNDLWEYSGGVWTLKSGSISIPSNSACTKGVYTSGSYVVGGRAYAATWMDSSGNLWLFGGLGCGDTSTSVGDLNDLWMYNTISGNWTFEGGDEATGQIGSYGRQYVASTSYLPGGRSGAVALTGSDGNVWLFGGNGIDSNGTTGYLNDLWKFNPTSKEWTWVTGSLTSNKAGTYGTIDVASISNTPSSRTFGASGVDSSGNLWFFGGWGYDSSASSTGNLNDLWRFNPSTLAWTWISGSKYVNQSGIYGTQYTAASSNVPGTRTGSRIWFDEASNLWLFGGSGYDSTGSSSELNDLWEFDLTSMEWTWTGGANTGTGAATIIRTKGTPSITNIPGGRSYPAAWIDSEGDFWLYGGYGNVSSTYATLLNDLWEAILPTPTPAFSLAAGTYQGSQTMTISDAMNGAAIYYTTDGTTPATYSTEYTGAITLGKSENLQAIALLPGHSQSLIRQAQYTVVNTPSITWATPATIAYGTALSSMQLDATASYGGTTVAGTYAYTSESGATVAAGTVLTAGNHTLTVTFKPTDTTDYTTATASVALTVTQDSPTITWSKPASIVYGTALGSTQLNATATYGGATVAGTYIYSPAAGTILPAGTQTLTVTFTPTDTTDYATVSASTTITVTQATPVITWQNPASIDYGTALSSAQLDATASVSGTFAYSPAAGTVLSAGSQTLSVTFTPSDATDYTTATASVTLTVAASDFTVTVSPSSQSVYIGYSTEYVVTVTPVNGTYSSAVSLAVSGLPTGATATFASTSLTPGTTAASTTLTIQAPSSYGSNARPASPFGPAPRALAMMAAALALFGFRRVRKSARKLLLVLALVLSLGAVTSLTACTASPKSIYWQYPYTLTVTGTSGSTTHSAPAVLTLEY
jgi:N-acetylneuraminic acid mutarotase